MVKSEWNYGVIKEWMKSIFGGTGEDALVKSLALQNNIQSECSSPIVTSPAVAEVKILKNELAALELLIGKLIVERERFWRETRLRTIAKLQLKNPKKVQHDQWIREVRSLSRYFGAVEGRDAAIAREMLHPYLP